MSEVLGTFEEVFALARKLRDSGKPAEARALLVALSDHHPDRIESVLELGYMALHEHDYEEGLSRFLGAREAFPDARDRWLSPLTRTYKLLGRQREAEALWTNGGDGSDPARTAEFISQNILVPAEEIEAILDSYRLDGPWRALCSDLLRRKAQFRARCGGLGFHCVSLGRSCLISVVCAWWGLRSAVMEEARRLPFDLGVFALPGIVELLETDFSGFADPALLSVVAEDEMRGEAHPYFVLPAKGIRFNHDFARNYRFDPAVFAAALEKRVRDFRSVVRENDCLLVCYVPERGEITDEITGRLAAYLASLPCRHRLLLLAGSGAAGAGNMDEIGRDVFLCGMASAFHPDWFKSVKTIGEAEESIAFQSEMMAAVGDVAVRSFSPGASCPSSPVPADPERRRLREIAAEHHVEEYLRELARETGGEDRGRWRTTGAIVMNCNPFTLGHRYLIKKAASGVDRLVVFVLEEDRSFFPFADRFRLVREGVSDLENVRVVRSGKFIISTLTFPIYFTKDNPDLASFDASRDLAFFGQYIAPALGITKRFVGTEPTCPVTSEYNRQLRAKLPGYGVEVTEIVRKEADGAPISASRVRKYLSENNLEAIRSLVPPSTYVYLAASWDDLRQAMAISRNPAGVT